MDDQIREILRSIDAPEASELKPEVSFQDSGTLNSLQLLDLIIALERTFGLAIANAEVIPENLDSIGGIVRFVETKRTALATAE